MHEINIARDFSRAPGGRFKTDGEASGEDFRERFLEPLFKLQSGLDKICIVLDGSYGYPTSFLEEAFGGLARKFGAARVLAMFDFVSKEEPMLVEEIKDYIGRSAEER